jgi:NADP-dependent 3-hydroxy acid dehydrogenase YdfG
MKELDPLLPSDVGAAIVFVLSQPRRVNINELMIRPTGQLG